MSNTVPEDPHAVPAGPAETAAVLSDVVTRDAAGEIASADPEDALGLAATAVDDRGRPVGEPGQDGEATDLLKDRGVVEGAQAPTVERLDYKTALALGVERAETAREATGRKGSPPTGEDLALVFGDFFTDEVLGILRGLTPVEAASYLYVLILEGPFRDGGAHTFGPWKPTENFKEMVDEWADVSAPPLLANVCQTLQASHREEQSYRHIIGEALRSSPYITSQAACFSAPGFNPVSDSFEKPAGATFVSKLWMCFEMALNILQDLNSGTSGNPLRPYPSREAAVHFFTQQGLCPPAF